MNEERKTPQSTAELAYGRALDSSRRVRHVMALFHALAGLAALHWIHGRTEDASQAATEALEHYRTGGFPRFRNRIDDMSPLQVSAAVCCSVLAAIAAEAGEPERAAILLGQADQLRTDASAGVPPFQRDDEERARKAARAALGSPAFLAAFERGRTDDAVLYRP